MKKQFTITTIACILIGFFLYNTSVAGDNQRSGYQEINDNPEIYRDKSPEK